MPDPDSRLQTANVGAKQRLKVLISAYACEPGKGSEPAVGWNVATEMARHHDVWVLTRSNNRENIERELAMHPVCSLHFIYHDLPRWAMWWEKGGRGVQLYYYLWQLTAIPKARRIHSDVNFDMGHHVTFVKYWVPSFLAWLDIPFVWGPVGGADSTPFKFLLGEGIKGLVQEVIRDAFKWLSHWDPLVRFTARKCAVCIPVTTKTNSAVHKLSSRIQTRLMTQVGMTKSELVRCDQAAEDEASTATTDFLYVGNLIFLKGVHLALRAFAQADIAGSRFLLVGDGSKMQELKELAMALGIGERVEFCGRLPLNEVMHNMINATALVHLSLHDSGGFVPIEAMACRKPVLCLDLAGPAVLVSDACGIRVVAHSPEQVVKNVAESMRRLSTDSVLREKMGAAGRARVEEHFLWEKKALEFCRVYEEVLAQDA